MFSRPPWCVICRDHELGHAKLLSARQRRRASCCVAFHDEEAHMPPHTHTGGKWCKNYDTGAENRGRRLRLLERRPWRRGRERPIPAALVWLMRNREGLEVCVRPAYSDVWNADSLPVLLQARPPIRCQFTVQTVLPPRRRAALFRVFDRSVEPSHQQHNAVIRVFVPYTTYDHYHRPMLFASFNHHSRWWKTGTN